MTILPAVVILGTTVAVGLVLAVRVWRGERNAAGLIGLHFLLGAATLEVLVVGFHGQPGGLAAAGGLGKLALLLIAGALLTGIGAVMLAKSRQGILALVGLHGAVAASALTAVVLLYLRL